MEVDWIQCKGGVWCDLFKVDLNHSIFDGLDGVYIIWHGNDQNRQILRVGYGNIRQELQENKNDLAMQAFAHLGVRVTWAEISSLKRKGVNFYLNRELEPSLEKPYPNAMAMSVNLPWD